MSEEIDWYSRRSELEPGMVFSSCWGRSSSTELFPAMARNGMP